MRASRLLLTLVVGVQQAVAFVVFAHFMVITISAPYAREELPSLIRGNTGREYPQLRPWRLDW